MNKNDLIKWALIAGAAYLVYRYLQSAGYLGAAPAQAGPVQLPSAATQTTAQPSYQAAPSTTVVAPPVAVPANDIRSRFSAASAADETGTFDSAGARMHNYWHFNYMYNAITGKSLPDPSVLGIDPYQDMTFEEFWGVLSTAQSAGETAGLPGLSAIYRLASAWA